MKLFLMPHEPSWWVWTVTAVLLAFGISGHPESFLVAIALSVMQTFFFLNRERAFAAYSVQIRVAYAALLLVAFVPELRWLYWAPMVGTLARVLFGYCLLSRLLSLMPWNRHEPITFDLLRRTLLPPPVVRRVHHGLPNEGCSGGICSLEARAAGFTPANTLGPTRCSAWLVAASATLLGFSGPLTSALETKHALHPTLRASKDRKNSSMSGLSGWRGSATERTSWSLWT